MDPDFKGPWPACPVGFACASGPLTPDPQDPGDPPASNSGGVGTAWRPAGEAAALALQARKLLDGIGDTPFTGRSAAYGTGENANDIAVTITGVNNGDAVNLSATESAVPDHPHGGWKGMQYRAAPDGGGAYEAHIYSNPAEGDKFGRHGAGSGYEYGLDANGWLSESHTEGTASRVASLSFDQAAGVKSFELGTGNQYVSISGTYHGVSGEYRCTPGTGNNCAAQKVAEGFNLGGVTSANAFDAGNAVWTFKPTDPEARVMSTPDTDYLSYGWWLHKAANDGAFTASAFVLEKGTVEAASGLDTLQGSATYRGGAAGKYALSTTVGTNDAGHFTARATLNADFSDNSVTGTIDHFRGADGESRDWSVELKEAALSATGEITRTAAGQENNDTVWTIGGTAGDASGEWSGSLRDNGADGVPKVGTGTFHTTYGNDGQMVGAFGVNKGHSTVAPLETGQPSSIGTPPSSIR